MIWHLNFISYIIKLGMASPWWDEMGKFDEAKNEKMNQNCLGKGSLHQSGFSMIEKFMRGQ